MAKERYEYENGVLGHFNHARLDVASRCIAGVCEENYGSGLSTSIITKYRRYNECLLEQIV